MPAPARPRPSLRVLLLAAVVALGTVGAADARADGASLAVLDTAGTSDPAADLARVFAVTGNSTTPKSVYVKFRNVGGAPCAPSASTDTGDTRGFLPYGTDVNGDFDIRRAGTWTGAGAVRFCIWIASSSSAIATPVQQDVTFRAPAGTVAATLTPGAPLPDQPATVVFSGSAEAPSELFATVKAGGGCAPTAATDGGDRIVSGTDVSGGFAIPVTLRGQAAGVYTICSWVADSSSDATPLAGPQPLVFTVVAPVVPPAPVAPTPPACALVTRSVRRGTGVRIRCYRTSGPIRVRLKRGGRTVVSTTAGLRSGVAKIGTRKLRRGASYKVSILGPTGKIGSGTVRIRR